jgi:serine/threonine protein kinase
MHLSEVPKPLPSSLRPFDAVIQKAMKKNPQDRYPSASTFRLAMENALVSTVAKEETRKQRVTPTWKQPLPLEEDSTQSLSEERTVITPLLRVEETIKLPQLSFEPEWPLEAPLPTQPIVQPYPSWVKKVTSLWKRVSRLWQVFQRP